jgi:hypothetical protein
MCVRVRSLIVADQTYYYNFYAGACREEGPPVVAAEEWASQPCNISPRKPGRIGSEPYAVGPPESLFVLGPQSVRRNAAGIFH